MTKATDIITSDHREAERLFERFQRQPDRSLALELCDLLEQHTEMEEQILYPELKAVDEELYQDAMEEHEEADELIKQIRDTDDEERLAQLVSELQEKVDHHVNDEETEDLPKMEEICDPRRMDELGREMQEWKDGRVGGGAGEDLVDLTKDELYEKAKEADIEGRSDMTKDELIEQLSRR